jgi:hypothetical protein
VAGGEANSGAWQSHQVRYGWDVAAGVVITWQRLNCRDVVHSRFRQGHVEPSREGMMVLLLAREYKYVNNAFVPWAHPHAAGTLQAGEPQAVQEAEASMCQQRRLLALRSPATTERRWSSQLYGVRVRPA